VGVQVRAAESQRKRRPKAEKSRGSQAEGAKEADGCADWRAKCGRAGHLGATPPTRDGAPLVIFVFLAPGAFRFAVWLPMLVVRPM
jgi:hypothetical protein